jgi:hypothetical protein
MERLACNSFTSSAKAETPCALEESGASAGMQTPFPLRLDIGRKDPFCMESLAGLSTVPQINKSHPSLPAVVNDGGMSQPCLSSTYGHYAARNDFFGSRLTDCKVTLRQSKVVEKSQYLEAQISGGSSCRAKISLLKIPTSQMIYSRSELIQAITMRNPDCSLAKHA